MSLDVTKSNSALESKAGELAEKLQNEIQSMPLVHYDKNGRRVHIRKKKGNINHASMFASIPSNGLSVMVCGYGIVFNSLLISSTKQMLQQIRMYYQSVSFSHYKFMIIMFQ